MPTYGYQCTQCDLKFDVFQRMSDAPIATCPECTGGVKRLFYPVGIVFKGSGWYVNDSRKPEKSSDSGETKTESKPAETTTTSSSTDTAPKSDASSTATPAKS